MDPMNVHPYLTFSGNCREAMTFYQRCLGGKLHFQTVGESPLSDKMPPEMKDCILHASLIKGPLRLLASDMVGETGLVSGNAVSLSLTCTSETELRTCFARLAEGGCINCPLQITFWGTLFGTLTDKYGHNWLLNVND
jgi:PhnB protein